MCLIDAFAFGILCGLCGGDVEFRVDNACGRDICFHGLVMCRGFSAPC